MPATISLPAETAIASERPSDSPRVDFQRAVILLAAGLALVVKLLIAWNTFGTNDVISFYRFGKSLSEHGLEWTYVSNVAFNHPPLVATYLQKIYEWDHLPWLHANGVTFPFLLRLPGIIADFVVVLLMLSLAPALRLPVWSLLVLAISPVSLMVSGFHGNTDPIMVMLLLLAAASCLWNRPILCGLFLALSSQIKIIPLLLVPIFFFYWMQRRKMFSFSLPFATTLLLLWLQPLLYFASAFLHRVLFYSSFWGLWGVTYWLRMTGVKDFGMVTYYDFLPLQQVAVTSLKLAIIAAVLVIAWRRRKLDARELFCSLGWAWMIFFIFSPGICAQYLVWPMPFFLALSPLLFAWFTATGSLFLFFFYNTIAGGFPWYLAISAGPANDKWLPWTVWPWTTLIVGAILLWKRIHNSGSSSPLLISDCLKRSRFS